ncbi:hypothetical protein [Massilia sp. DWR3-1-1]|uniref:hypothetical protein n=1 Tax=Massilia sp. DWR3-1-1 TaxID=2804559 RepID=UPI003CF0D9DE
MLKTRLFLRRFHRRLVACGFAMCALTPLCVGAQQIDDSAKPPPWRFGAYGSLGVVHSSESAADFSANGINPGRAGASHAYAYDVDSRLAAQVDLMLDAQWSAVLQVVSERDLDHDFTPAVEWANVKYRYSPELSVRLGRIALPIFLIGDYRKASYALPWVRPPVEVYSTLPVSNSDGIDATYSWSAGKVKNISQVSFGGTDLRTTATSRARARQLIGLSNTSVMGFLTVRASAMTTTLTVDIAKPLFDAYRQFGPAGAALAAKYDVDSKRTSIGAIGFNCDPGNWFLMGEIGRMNTRSYIGDKTVVYLSGGYRFGDLTPYVTYARARVHQATSDAGLSTAGLPPQFAPTAAYLNGQLNALLSTIASQRTATAGVRWDVMRDRSLKLQFDRLHPQGGSSGTLINVQPSFRSGHSIYVVSAMLDFVY